MAWPKYSCILSQLLTLLSMLIQSGEIGFLYKIEILARVFDNMESVMALLVVLGVVLGKPTTPANRIIGGVETDISEVPYQLALEWNGHQFCAATIISQEFAISASHCVHGFDPEDISVRTGSTSRETGGKIIPVKKFYLNPNYNKSKTDYDVALLELKSPIDFDLNSQPIGITDEEPKPGQKAVVSGWGSVQERGDGSLHLQSLQISIIDWFLCKNSYKKIEEVTERMFCAGAPGFDSCKGDSGGPIVLGQELVGIVSWGKGCGRQGYPGVYTNVANPEIREFVRNITGI